MTQKRLLALVLMVLGMVPSTAFAVNGKVFCVTGDDDGKYKLYQMNVTQGGAISADCYASWYDEKNPSVYTVLQEAMKNETVPFKSLTITSNLDFGGMESSANACADASFKPLDISSMGEDSVLVAANEDVVIENLCYISETSNVGYYGFFGAVKNANISNLTFDNAYVAVTEPYSSSKIVETYVGVLAGAVVRSSVQNVTVKNSQVLGNYVGGLVGLADEGSQISRFVGEGIRVSNDKDNSSTRDYVYLGGVVGKLREESSVSLSSLNLLNITSNAYGRQGFMGGIAGFVDGTYSEGEPVYDNYVMGTFFENNPNRNNVGYAIGHVKYNSIGRLMHSVYYVIKSGTSSIPSDAFDPSVIGSFEYGSKSLSQSELEKISEDHALELNGDTIIAGVYKEDVTSAPLKNLKGKLAVQLNLSESSDGYSGSDVWTCADDMNDGYPFFADEKTYKAIQKVKFTFRTDAMRMLSSGLLDEIRGYGSNNSSGEWVIYLLTGNDKATVVDNSDESGELTGKRMQEIYENLENLGFLWVGDGTSIAPFTASSEFTSGIGYRLTPPTYVLTFDINIDSKFYKNTFFTVDFLQEGVLSRKLSEHVDKSVLQEIGVFRTDSCFEGGWRTKKDGVEEVWDVRDLFEDDTFKKLEMTTDAGGQRVVKLYANWGACQSEPWEMELVRENCNDCKVKLVQEDANGNRYEHPFESNGSKMVVAIPRVDEAYYFPVTVEAEETEEKKLVDKDPFDLWESILHVEGPWNKADQPYSLTFSAYENTKLYVRYKGLPTHVTFDENTTENVFYGSNWVEKGKFNLATYEEDFPRIYRAGYCFDGWRLDKDDIDAPVFRTGVELNEVLDEMGGKDSVELFAAWNEFDFDGNTCEAKTITMVSDGNGTVALNMTLPDKSHKDYPLEAKDDIVYQISVPGIFDERDTMKFNIVQKPDDGFTLLRANLSTDGSSLGDYLNNLESSMLKGTDLSDSMSLLYEGENIIVGLPFVKNVRYDFVLDFGLEKDTLDNTMFFASAEERYEFGPKDSLRLRELIPVIYDAGNEKFVSNWSLDESGEYRLYSPNLYDAATKYRKENKAIELVAKWEYGLPTNTSFDITGAKFENGSVNLVQVYNDQVIRHNMSESSVSLPQLDEKFVYAFKVEAVPGKGFVLDKPVEVFVEVAGDTSFTLELKDGDLLVLSSLGRTASKLIRIKAEFEPAIEIAGGFREISEVELALSGDAVRFSVPSNVFSKGASARVTMQLMDALGNVIADTLLYEGKEPPEVIDWERFPLSVGRYAFKAVIENGDDKIDFNRDFVVKNELATESCDDCWHMVGLSNVKLKSVDWSDAEFYWWDESRNFGRYWQYQEFLKNESPVEGRGYWFNTEKEQTLVLKDSVPRPEDFVWVLDSVYSGWNMVSNPYSWYIDAYALYMVEEGGAANKADTADVKFWRWDAKAGAYEPVQYLAPHEAVWARVSRKVKWEIPEMPCYVTVLDEDGNLVPAPGLKSSVSLFKASNAKDSFTLRAVLADSKGRVDRWNTIGVGDQAVMAEEPPQGMGDFVNLSVVDGKKALATSLKKHSDAGSYEWNMELKAADIRMGYLSFEGVDELKAKGLSLYVTVDGETTEVQEGKALNVTVGKDAKKANVYVAASPRKVASATLQGLKAVQVGRMLQVNFVADASLAGGMTHVELVSLQGQVMASASAKTLAGANTLNLETPKSGVYMLRVKTGNLSAVSRILVR